MIQKMTVLSAAGAYVAIFGANKLYDDTFRNAPLTVEERDAKVTTAMLGASAASVGIGVLLGGFRRPNSVPRGMIYGGAIAAGFYLLLREYISHLFERKTP